MSVQIAYTKAQPPMAGARPVSLRRLATFAPLSAADEALIKRLKPKTLSSHSVLSGPEAQGEQAWIVLSGWCARVRALPGGQRQIVNLVLPGDPVGVDPQPWAGSRLPVVALTPVIVADAEPLRGAVKLSLPEHARLIEACERATWCEQVYCLNAIVRLGQQSAYDRLAHLLLEIHSRLEAVGLTTATGFQLPVTQDVIAHALGLSLVHLSRTLRQMRQHGAISLEGGHVELLKAEALAKAANFPFAASSIH